MTMETRLCDFSEIRPFVRFAGPIRVQRQPEWMAYDHRLFFVQSDRAAICVRSTVHRLQKGDALLICSGVPYHIPQQPTAQLVSINFDFFSDAATAHPLPLPMIDPRAFLPERRMECVRFRDGVLSDGFWAIRGMFELMPVLDAMQREYSRSEWLYASQLHALMTISLNLLYRRGRQLAQPRAATKHQDILDYIAAHFTEALTNRSIAAHFHYHPNYVNQLVRDQTGLPLHRYLLRLRIQRATALLLSDDRPVSEVAAQTGFADTNYFSQYFRRCIGCSPSAFRGAHSAAHSDDPAK